MKIHFKLPDNKFPLLFFTSLSLTLFSLLIVSVSLFSQLDNYKKEVITLNSRIEKLDKENKSLFLKLPQNIEIAEVFKDKLKEEEISDNGTYDCTLTVDKLDDIKPVYGCLVSVSDITLKDFPINGKNNTIHAIFTQLSNYHLYSLDLYFNDKEVLNNPLAHKQFENKEELWEALAVFRFTPIMENGVNKGLLVLADRAAQGPIQDVIVINSLGEIVFSDSKIFDVFQEYNPVTKTDLPYNEFVIETAKVEYPPSFCVEEDQFTPETIVTEYNTYILIDDKVKHLKKEEITYEEILSGCNDQ